MEESLKSKLVGLWNSKALNKDDIQERWSFLIEGANGRGGEILKGTTEKVAKIEAPKVKFRREVLTPQKTIIALLTIIPLFTVQKREFLAARNQYLKGYKIYIGAKDYGKQLYVSWYLTCESGLIEKLMGIMTAHWIITLVFLPLYVVLVAVEKISKKSVSPTNLSIFDSEELGAYVSTVHHAVLDSVSDLMRNLKQDPTKMDRKSRGFLNIT